MLGHSNAGDADANRSLIGTTASPAFETKPSGSSSRAPRPAGRQLRHASRTCNGRWTTSRRKANRR